MLTGGDLSAVSTNAATPNENVEIEDVPAGPQTICQVVGLNRFHTTGRCVQVDVPSGGTASSLTDAGLHFGSAPQAGCGNGVLTNNIRAISLNSGTTYFRSTNITGPAPTPHLGTRMSFSGSNPVTYVRNGEFISNGLLVSGISTTTHANLVLKLSYNTGRQTIDTASPDSVVAADGTEATFLGSGPILPSPLPNPGEFSWFDKNGEIYVFNVPTTDDGTLYQDVYVITEVTAANTNISIKTTAAVAGKLVGGSLVTISSTCGDSADSRTFSNPASTSVIDTNLVVDDVINKPY